MNRRQKPAVLEPVKPPVPATEAAPKSRRLPRRPKNRPHPLSPERKRVQRAEAPGKKMHPARQEATKQELARQEPTRKRQRRPGRIRANRQRVQPQPPTQPP